MLVIQNVDKLRIKLSLVKRMLGFVIGDSSMVTGFRLVGVEGTEATTVEDAMQAMRKALTRNDLTMVMVSEEFSMQPQLQEIIEKFRREHTSPLIVELPGSQGKPSEIHLSDLISRILGAKI